MTKPARGLERRYCVEQAAYAEVCYPAALNFKKCTAGVNIFYLKNVCKAFHDRDAVVEIAKGLSWSIAPGENAALLGESGVGKTTLINIIAGLDTADTGEVFVADTNIASLSDTSLAKFRREKLGLIFQRFHLVSSLNAWDNAALQARLGQRFDTEFANYLFESLSINRLKNRYPSELSGGQQQRVAIARALMHKPSLVLADEPTGSLDEETSEKVIDLLVGITSQLGATLVVVTHSTVISAHLTKRWQLFAGQISEVK